MRHTKEWRGGHTHHNALWAEKVIIAKAQLVLVLLERVWRWRDGQSIYEMCNWRGSDIDMRAHVWHTKVERRAHHTTTHTTRMRKLCIIAKAVKLFVERESSWRDYMITLTER